MSNPADTAAFEKLDATLHRILENDGQAPVRVFVLVQGNVSDQQRATLASHGVNVSPQTVQGPLSGSMSPTSVATLSQEPWVRAIRAAGSRHPLG